MFIGHFAVGFAAKRLAPRASLGTLFLAAQFVDLLWPTLLLLGVERVRIEPGITRVTPLDFEYYPWSHSLLAALGWGLAFATGYFAIRRLGRESLIVGLAVPSHWLLDLVVHRPDLPLHTGASPLLGMGLWNSVAGTLALETSLFAWGVWLYVRCTRPVNATGTWALGGFVACLLLVYALNLFGQPPPGVRAIAWAGQAQWLLVGWGYWIDARRRTLAATRPITAASGKGPVTSRPG